MKKIFLGVFILFTINNVQSQINMFNKYYDTLSVHKANEFSSIVETDSGYVAFNSFSFAVHFINSLGNLIHTKSFLDTNNYFNRYWVWNNSLDIVEPLNSELQTYYIQASGMHRIEYDSTMSASYHLTKYNHLFDTVWTRDIVYTDSIILTVLEMPGELYDCFVDDDGYIYATGMGRKFLNGSTFSNYGNIIFLKADNTGNPILLKTFPFINVNEYSYGSRIIETFDNRILIGGNLDYSPQGYLPTPKSYVLNINKQGEFNWHKIINNSKLSDIILTKDSCIIYCGTKKVINPSSTYGAASITKIDSNGNTLWETLIGRGDGQTFFAKHIIELKDSSLICVVAKSNYSIWGYQLLMYKLSGNGEIMWHRSLNPDLISLPSPSFNMESFDLLLSKDNGFLISGYINKVVYSTPFLIKTDSLGCDGLYSCMDTTTMMYLQTWEDSVCNGDSVLVSIAISNGHAPYTGIINGTELIQEPLFIMPDTSSYMFYAHPTIGYPYVEVTIENPSGAFYSSFLQFNVIDCSISVNELLPEITFKVFPNPANNFIRIKAFKGKYLKKQIEIYNQHGILVYTDKLFNTESEIDVSKYAKGIYTIKLITNKGIGIEKFVKL